ncbi:hypothetical protein CK203_100797 [Vitis vinifera]|uniref:Reverse transcriptase domain-containing protein n=1 Tax=Vitis vinifera TaxID=29760 RepID=A0A438CJI6_VITVI|nr:hypothetical protein CK203_100797 [Vitis vinifera]
MTKIFRPLIGQTLEVYTDDIVVKNKTKSEHTRYLEETFRLMKTYNMKLNPAKYAFGVNAGKPFFLTLKGASSTRWISDYELAFEEIKRYLTQPPILSSPQLGEQLYMYLAVSNYAVSVVLFRCINDKEQRLVYYISKIMVDAKTWYSKMEQTVLALRSVA